MNTLGIALMVVGCGLVFAGIIYYCSSEGREVEPSRQDREPQEQTKEASDKSEPSEGTES